MSRHSLGDSSFSLTGSFSKRGVIRRKPKKHFKDSSPEGISDGTSEDISSERRPIKRSYSSDATLSSISTEGSHTLKDNTMGNGGEYGRGHVIPKSIHQMWIQTGNRDYTGYPAKYASHIGSIKNINKGFGYRFWNEENILALLETDELSDYRETYFGLKYTIQKADFARFMILYMYGGFYIDCDFKAVKSLDGLLSENSKKAIIITFESNETLHGKNKICIGFMGASPKHPFIKGYLDYLKGIHKNPLTNTDVVSTTGPAAFYKYTSSNWPNIWKKWLIPTHKILPLDDKGNPTKISIDNGGLSSSYVYTIWRDGSGWVYEIIVPGASHYIIWIALIILVLIIIVLIFVPRGREPVRNGGRI